MFKRSLLATFSLILIPALAAAATLSEVGDGALLNDKPAGEVPIDLNAGDRITGPATITPASGGSIILAPGAILRVEAIPEDGSEPFSLLAGAARGVLVGDAELGASTGWLGAVGESECQFFVERVSNERAFFQAYKGEAVLSYQLSASRHYTVDLRDGNGIEFSIPIVDGKPVMGDLCFATNQDNPTPVVLNAQITSELLVTMTIPQATSGCLVQEDGGTVTRINNDLESLKTGVIQIQTELTGEVAKKGSITAGAYVLVINATGDIEPGLVEIDFEIIERAISLTSEFSTLAVSNFFALGRVGSGGGGDDLD